MPLSLEGGLTAINCNFFADKWSNCFTATIRATNGSPNVIPITDYWGEYMNHGRVDHMIVTWLSCDQNWYTVMQMVSGWRWMRPMLVWREARVSLKPETSSSILPPLVVLLFNLASKYQASKKKLQRSLGFLCGHPCSSMVVGTIQ